LQSFTGPQDILLTTLINWLLASVLVLPSLYHWLFFLCSLHFYWEAGGSKFLWNSKYLPDCMVLHSKMRYSFFLLQLVITSLRTYDWISLWNKTQNYEGYSEGNLQ
jgi:hypothetical protein